MEKKITILVMDRPLFGKEDIELEVLNVFTGIADLAIKKIEKNKIEVYILYIHSILFLESMLLKIFPECEIMKEDERENPIKIRISVSLDSLIENLEQEGFEIEKKYLSIERPIPV